MLAEESGTYYLGSIAVFPYIEEQKVWGSGETWPKFDLRQALKQELNRNDSVPSHGKRWAKNRMGRSAEDIAMPQPMILREYVRSGCGKAHLHLFRGTSPEGVPCS